MKLRIAIAISLLTVLSTVVACSKDGDPTYRVVGASTNGAPLQVQAQATEGMEAAAEMSEQLSDAQIQPNPIFGFGWPDQTGNHLNVREGERLSWEPEDITDDAPEVWFFGGSALFGFATQRDDFTVPSAYAKAADEAGLPVRVRNFAVPGHTNFQETQKLSVLLSAGRRPDLVVFLDGYNDALLATGNGIVGDRQAGSLSHSQWHRYLSLAEDSPRYKGPRTGFVLGPPKDFPYLGVTELSDVVVRLYSQGVDLAQHLGTAYDFDVVHAWQPDLYTKRLVGDEEQVRASYGISPATAERWARLSKAIRAGLGDKVVDYTTIFDDVPQPIMADMMHFNEDGAAIIGQDLWNRTGAQLKARS